MAPNNTGLEGSMRKCSISSTTSTTIEKGLNRTEYECLGTGRRMSLQNRKMDHQELHPKTAAQEKLFHSAKSLDWQPMTDYSRGMHSIEYGKLPGMVEQGFIHVEKGGLLPLHWHKETEHYVIFRGTATVQVGDECGEINGDKDPTLVIIPGNCPHQIANKHKEPLMLYYYFPEQETFEDDISYYFPCGKIEPPGSDWLASKEKSVIGAALINSILLGANLPGVGDVEMSNNQAEGSKTGNLMPTVAKGSGKGKGFQARAGTKKAPDWVNKLKSVLSFHKGKQIKRFKFKSRRASTTSSLMPSRRNSRTGSRTASRRPSRAPSPTPAIRKKYNLDNIPYGEPNVSNMNLYESKSES